MPGLPIGTRGGVSTSYTFAQDGEYEIQILLARDLAGVVSGLRDARPHEMLVLLDREPVQTFTISRAAIGDDTLHDKDLKARIPVKAGPHNLARHIRQGRLIAYRHAQAADSNPASTTGDIRVRRPPSTRFR